MNRLVEIENLSKTFSIKGRTLNAVKGVNITLFEGATLGLVGESGCGKSTIAKSLINLIEPTSGTIKFGGQLVNKKSINHLRRDMQLVFQDPGSSLNPRMTVEQLIEEPLIIHKLFGRMQRKERVKHLLKLVGLLPHYLSRFPHELSGGQKQRVSIARALSLEPKLLILDEPISALDVSIQAQIINLLQELQSRLNLTYLFISHDLAMVRHISTHVAVMYLGEIVEYGLSDEIFSSPMHPYTRALIDAVPILDPSLERKRERYLIEGELMTHLNPKRGCPFAGRCPLVTAKCLKEKPPMRSITPSRELSCFVAKLPAERPPAAQTSPLHRQPSSEDLAPVE